MNLNDFLSLDYDHIILSSEARSLNEWFAKISPKDIPLEDRKRVVDYLVEALNMKSVEYAIVQKLELLLNALQTDT